MKFVHRLENLFAVFPHLSEGTVTILVQQFPAITFLAAFLCLIVGPVLGVLGSLTSLVHLNPVLFIITLLNVAFLIIESVLLLSAYPRLKKHQAKGWLFVFWGMAVLAGSAGFSILLGDIIDAAIKCLSTVLGLYLLFEVKHRYR
jgi:hypothetical protein